MIGERLRQHLACWIPGPRHTRPTGRCAGTIASGFASLLLASHPVLAQSVSGDAREIGLGGVDYAAEVFGEDPKGPRSNGIVLPLGLLQATGQWKKFKPSSSQFDPALLYEYAAVPTHLVIGRDPQPGRAQFLADIRDANLNPDLNVYRGFRPVAALSGSGLLAPRFGKTFSLPWSSRVRHQVFAGGGPYLSIESDVLFDQRLVSMFGASSATYVRSSALEIGNTSTGQAAAQITAGYRAQIPHALKNGLLTVEANYNHLQGFRFESADVNLRLDTDARGFVSTDPTRGAPLAIDRRSSSSGRGRSMDVAFAALFDRWRFSARADGIGNQITWHDMTRREHEKSRLSGGLATFATRTLAPLPDFTYSLPTQYRMQAAYLSGGWGAIAELEHGLLRRVVTSAGVERRFNRLQLRGGARFLDRIVLPSAGVSLRLGGAWLDVGAALTTANIERQRNVIIASSIRFAL